jgi:hypothetical protein
MAFKGTELVRRKIVIENMILEQVNTFTYLGCNIFQNHNFCKYWDF